MNEITSITIGSNVEQLGAGLFKDMTHLVSVDFTQCGNIIEELPPSCFAGCSNFTKAAGLPVLTAISDCDFMDCTSLEYMEIPDSLVFVGTSAFARCGGLQQINRLNDSNSSHTFDVVGDYAFAETGIISANLALRSSATQTFWGDRCFAGCKSLERVDFLSSCYMSNGMFKDCTKLSQVNFLNNHTSYVCPYVFQNCTALQSITLPSKIWYISEGMFKGCTELQTVYFTEYGNDSLINFVQKRAFDGCQRLYHIEFPQSLTGFSQMEDGCLSNCMQNPYYYKYGFKFYHTPELFFHGIQADDIYTESIYDVDLIQGRVIHLDLKNVDAFSKITTALTDLKIKYCVVFNQKWVDNIIGCWNDETINWAAPSNMGMSVAAAKDGVFIDVTEWLGQDLYDMMEPQHRSFTPEELAEMRSDIAASRNSAFKAKNKKYDIFTYFYYFISNESLNVRKAINNIQVNAGNYALVFSVDPSKPIKSRIQVYNKIDTSGKLNNACGMNNVAPDDIGKVYNYHVKWNDAILSSGMFRLNRDCIVRTYLPYRHDQTYDYSALKWYQRPYVEVVKPDSDHDTITGFSVGTWYYNAKDVVPWADSHNTPVLVIYSLLGCKPCQIYEKMIWSNPDFQTWARKQNFYLCGMEVMKQTYYDQQYKYCVDVLTPEAENFQDVDSAVQPQPNAFGETFRKWRTADGGLNQDLNTPILAFRKDGKTWLYTYHFIDKWIQQVGAEGVIQCLKSLCLYHFDGNNLDGARFVVDAGRKFNRLDYVYNDDNPYRISPSYEESGIIRAKLPVVIDLLRWEGMAKYDKTAQGAMAAMKAVLSKAGTSSANYPEYIGDCLFGDFDWLTLSLSPSRLSKLQKGPGATINKTLGADILRIKIDQQVYILQVEENQTKSAKTPCSGGNVKLYKYKFVKSSMPTASEYREDDEPLD